MAGDERLAQRHAVGAVGADGVILLPESGLGAEEAPQDPLTAQERVHLEAGEVLVLEFGELVAVLANDELRFSGPREFCDVSSPCRGESCALRRLASI